MYYNSFLLLMSQLSLQKAGKILLDELEIEVRHFLHLSQWELSTYIHSHMLPLYIRESLRSGRRFHLDAPNCYLQKGEGGVVFVQRVPSPKGYIQYKSQMKDFFDHLCFWTKS